MTLYHGSYMEVRTPDLNHSRKSVDFGSGFYTATISRQGFYQYLARQALEVPGPGGRHAVNPRRGPVQ